MGHPRLWRGKPKAPLLAKYARNGASDIVIERRTQPLTNSISRVMVTSSPTIRPPVSRTGLQVRPKSLRLIFVVADNPTRVLPHGSFIGGVGPSTSKVTLRVTPWMVRPPATCNSPSALRLTWVDLNDRVGYFSTSKKSALFRCVSRCGSRVVMGGGAHGGLARGRGKGVVA